jgi:chaperonin GroEL
MSKLIKFGPEGREKMVKGIDTLADAVVSTLGPNGRNVAIQQEHNQVQSTKDGVTVAKHIGLKDPFEQLGVNLIQNASIKTADKAGDGTTTSTLLAREMIRQGLQHLNNGANAVDIKRGINKAVKEVVKVLKLEISEDITSEGQLEQVATISSNNDQEVGKLIATAIEKVGVEGIVHIEESKSGDTFLETVEGMQFDRGFKSPYFVTDNNTMTSTLSDVSILIADHKFTNVKELLPVLEGVAKQGKSLLIIAEDIDHEALATLIVNKQRGTLNVCAVKAPDFGDRRKLILEDIAIMTGGQVFDKSKGMKLDKFSWDWFGEARTATIGKDKTTLIDGKGDEEAINSRASELANQVEGAESEFEREQLQSRLAKICGGVSIIHVGGLNETEMNEKKDRVDDALHATKAAQEEGIVPGGGAALLYARESITKDNIGAEIVYISCGKPFEQILINAGHDSVQAQMLGRYQLVESGNNTWAGYNIKTDEVVDMKEAGIIDPTKVTRVALENAAAVAGTVLLTECIVVDEPADPKNVTINHPTQGMMGM